MNQQEQTTIERIHACAMEEFLQNGFQKASLRKIVRAAGVTTGAFYGYYTSKEALFDALVGEPFNTLMGMYRRTQEAFTRLSPEEQAAGMGQASGDCLQQMLEYAHAHHREFKLLLCASEGTRYEPMVHDMVEIEVEATHAFADVMEGLGHPRYELDPTLEHILVSGLFSAFFELIIHDVPLEQAKKHLNVLRAFYTAGWQKVMGL